jgi:HK97 family phage major capsid protein
MKSLKELLNERTKLVLDNRKVLDAPEGPVGGNGKKQLSSSQTEEYEKRDAEIEALTGEIEARGNVESLKDKAKRYDEMEAATPPRQVPAVAPARPGSDGASLMTFDVGRHKLSVRPGDALHHRATDRYRDDFDRYLAYGEVANETLGLVASKDDKGGYLAPVAMASQLIKFVDNNVFMRGLATVLPPIPSAVSLGAVSYDADPGDGDWTAEVPASDISEDDTITFGKRELMPHLLTKLVKASLKFLQTASGLPGGAANFIGDRLGYKFAITEEKAFLTGTGAQQPLGVFVASDLGIPTSRDYTSTTTSGTDFNADDVINSLYTLKPQYQDRATGLFSRDFVKKLRTKKDGNGQYLWQPGLTAGQPDRVLNRPYKQSEYVPNTFTTGQYVGMWGDFQWYWIQDSMGLTIQRLAELFQLKNQIGMLARKETDGMPVLAEAFVRIKLA